MLDAKQIAEIVRSQDHDDEVSSSTLHYYVQVGLLPPAVGRGRSGYTPEHLTRFRLARYLKRQGIGLAQIRERLTRLTPEAAAVELASAQRDAEAPVLASMLRAKLRQRAAHASELEASGLQGPAR